MNNKQQPKVRLVKCPRCSKLLPEPEHVPLYSCGGCGTTLKAKYYKGHLKDITSSSHGRDVTRSNAMIHVRSSGESGSSSRRSSYSGEHAASQENGRDKDASDSGTEQNKAVNSSYDTSSSNETNSLKNKENGVIDNKLNHFDSKDIYKGRDENTVTSCTNAEQNGAASSSHHTALSEESGFTVKKESGEIDKEIDQFNSKDQVSNGFLTVLEKKESELHTMAGSATTDLNGQDEWHNDIAVDDHQQKQIGAVNNGSEKCTIEDSQVPEKKEMQHLSMVRETVEDEGDLHEQKQIGYAAFSSLTESSGTTNLAEHDASVSVVSKKMRKMHLGGEHFHQDKDEQKQKECVNSSEDASSMNVSSAIKDSVGPDVSDRESSEEIREMHLAGEHPHQDRHEHNQVGYVNSDKVISSLSESSAIKNSTAYPNHEASEETRIVHLEEQHMHQDQDEQKQTEYVNPSKGVSSLAVSSAIMSPGEPDAAEHEVSKETRELHLAETHIHQDRHERKQAGYMNSAKGAFSLSESSAIKNQSEYLNHEVSKETRNIHLVRECSHQGQHEYVNSPNIISSLTVPSAIETSTGPDASDHEVFEKTSKRHIVGNDFQQDQNEKKQDPAESTSSLTEYVAIEKVTQLAFNNMEEDASYCEVPDETRKKLLSDKHSQQDNLRSDIHHFNVNEPKEVEYSGKEFGNGRDSNNLVECIVEQDGNVKLSSEASLSTEITQGGNDCVSASSSAKNLKTSQEIGQTNSSMDPRKEFISDNGKRTSKENVKKFENMAVYTDTEVGSPLKEVPRYPTKRSPAYDGSVSSFDGNDDQVAEQPAQVDGETSSPINANAGYDGAEESPEWTNNMSERMMYRRYSRVEAQAKNSSSVQFEKKLKSSMVEEGGIREEYEIPQKINRYRPIRDSFLPRVPNHRRSSELAFETGSSSSYALHDESHQMHHHPYRRGFPEVPHWRGKEFISTYYNYETSGEIYDRPPKHHAYVDGRRRAESWSQSGTLPRIPYSGEIFNRRYPCMRRYPDDRRWSTQLPPPAVCCHQGAYMGPTWEARWDPYDSYPSSPRRFVESESSYAWGHDAVSLSDDQRHNDQIMRRLYLKRQALKRQFLPTAGGAPFISCYSCFNILLLPEDFLISKRRRQTHKLQCGACSTVLEFSLEKESGLARRETNVDRNANQAVSSSHVNHSRHRSLNSMDGRELLSRDSFEASGREKRKLVHGSLRRGERMETIDDDNSAPDRGRPPKVGWQVPARSKSPLHRLMGYSSPQDLLSLREADDLN